MKSNIFNNISLFLIILLLPSCYHVPIYKSKSLQFMDNECSYNKTEQNIILKARTLDKYDKKEIFGEYSKKLFDKKSKEPIEIIYIAIHNFSAANYILSLSNIDLKIISQSEILYALKTSPIARGLTVVTSLAIAGVSSLAAWAALFGIAHPLAVKVLYGSIVSGIAGLISSLKFRSATEQSLNQNEKITKDIEEKTINQNEHYLITPGSKFSLLLFVKKSDFKPNFTITLDTKNKSFMPITFDVKL